MISSSSNAAQLQAATAQESAYIHSTAALVQAKSSSNAVSSPQNSQSFLLADSYQSATLQTAESQESTSQASQSRTTSSGSNGLTTNASTKNGQPTSLQATSKQPAKPVDYSLPAKKTDTVRLSATAQAEALHQLGFTVSEIANRLGVNATAVDAYLKINPNATTPVFTASAAANSSSAQSYTASGSSS